MSNPKEASFRIECDTFGNFRVECLDKTNNHFYIVASKLGQGEAGLNKAVSYCKDHFLRQ